MDPRIERFLHTYTTSKHPVKGYRVQLFLGERAEAENQRRKFLLSFPHIGAYLTYQAPNFKVRVGDCRTRLEAERLRESLRAQYGGCYIVPDEIEMPPLEPLPTSTPKH
jgi:SPOR domain